MVFTFNENSPDQMFRSKRYINDSLEYNPHRISEVDVYRL